MSVQPCTYKLMTCTAQTPKCCKPKAKESHEGAEDSVVLSGNKNPQGRRVSIASGLNGKLEKENSSNLIVHRVWFQYLQLAQYFKRRNLVQSHFRHAGKNALLSPKLLKPSATLDERAYTLL